MYGVIRIVITDTKREQRTEDLPEFDVDIKSDTIPIANPPNIAPIPNTIR